ncbi:MAG: dihydroxyacetone kinase subunit L [Candidatus Chloroheliales bacterium]|nr:MAG: dihydroxyacetone kinase subunit L [Chloroflexota bacterium]
MEMNSAMVVKCLNLIADAIHEQRQYLTDLDAAIGDGDHGINMDRGFSTVRARLEGSTEQNIGATLKLVGSTLVSTVGGASGPLYGTAFLRAGAALEGKESLALDDVCAAMDAAVGGIMQRGKATTGEKTMLDALVPAQEALRQAQGEGATIPTALLRAAEAAEAGAKATIPMLATKGRASYLGERSIGHPDPGATSAALMLRIVANALAG